MDSRGPSACHAPESGRPYPSGTPCASPHCTWGGLSAAGTRERTGRASLGSGGDRCPPGAWGTAALTTPGRTACSVGQGSTVGRGSLECLPAQEDDRLVYDRVDDGGHTRDRRRPGVPKPHRGRANWVNGRINVNGRIKRKVGGASPVGAGEPQSCEGS
jgi:hypothetical protein